MLFFEFMKRFNFGEKLPTLHPIEDLEIEDPQLEKLIKTQTKL